MYEDNILKFRNTLNEYQKVLFNNIIKDIREIEKQKANVDELSNLYNRNGFNSLFKYILEEYEKKIVNCIYLIMFDMNYLKSINDFFGHNTGDLVLKELGNTIKTNTKKYANEDIKIYCSRYGGDEFFILISFIKKLKTEKMELLVNNIINGINIEFHKNYIIKNIILKIADKYNISINIIKLLSIGYTSSSYIIKKYKYNTDFINNMMKIVDEKMYEDKNKFKKSIAAKI